MALILSGEDPLRAREILLGCTMVEMSTAYAVRMSGKEKYGYRVLK